MYDGLRAWTFILRAVAEFAPVVAYDRAGIWQTGGASILPSNPRPDR